MTDLIRPTWPRLIPVIDLRDGIVVHAVAGKRDCYRPVASLIAPNAQPLDVALALTSTAHTSDIYVADLDAIQHHRTHADEIRSLVDHQLHVMLDAGVSDLKSWKDLLQEHPTLTDVSRWIIGSESLRHVDDLPQFVAKLTADRLAFSVDISNGNVLARDGSDIGIDPWQVACWAVSAGIRTLILLDLTSVGTASGPSSSTLCRRLRDKFQDVDLELIVGGGVRDARDLAACGAAGADAVLVATALHQRRLGRGCP